MKLHLIYLTLCSLSHAAYVNRMAILSGNPSLSGDIRIRPSAFRPGVMTRPWMSPRLVQAASHRVPYFIYKNPHRLVKHYTATRVGTGAGMSSWRVATRTPPVVSSSSPTSAELEFMRASTVAAAVARAQAHAAREGAIHTIPAPNLSLSQKPIVVLETDTNGNAHSISTEAPKVYHVTEKFTEYDQQAKTDYDLHAKIEQPIGFSKTASLTPPELQSLRNGAALQLASELGLSAVRLPQTTIHQSLIHQPAVATQPNLLQQHKQPNLPQQHSQLNQIQQQLQQNLLQHHSQPNLLQQHLQSNLIQQYAQPNLLQQHSQSNLIQQHSQPHLLQQHLQSNLIQQQQNLLHHSQPNVFSLLQHHVAPQHSVAHSITPQQFTLQNFHSLPNSQDIMHVGSDGIVITPNALYQRDPAFLQKLQNQLLQRFPGVEFVHYPAKIPTQVQDQSQQQAQSHVAQHPTPQPQTESPLHLLQNEEITKQTPSQFVATEAQNQKNVYLRAAEEGTFVTLVPQGFVTNATENHVEITSLTPQNVTVEFVAAESQPEASTIKYVIETTTEEQKAISYYSAIPQSDNAQTSQNQIAEASQMIHNVAQAVKQASTQNEGAVTPQTQTTENVQIAQNEDTVRTDSYYSAINDARARAQEEVQVEKSQEQNIIQENVPTTTNITTSTLNKEIEDYLLKQETNHQNNSRQVTELKPLVGVPFAKAQNSVNVAYTLHRSDDKDAKVAKDGSVYVGQIVEASVSEDQDFNTQKANLPTRRAPIRLVAVADNKNATGTTATPRVPQKVTVVKARIPPKSKLTYDDKTGEPVLRIYASYVDNSAQKEAIASRLSNNRREFSLRNKDSWKDTAAKKDSWKDTAVKALAKPHGFEPNPNQSSGFGLKLRSRSDDYGNVPMFYDSDYHSESSLFM